MATPVEEQSTFYGPKDPKTTSGELFRSPPNLDKAWYAPNGGKLFTRNLNADSAHPNPWRPPTLWEMNIPGNISDFNLGTWTQPTLTKQELTMEHSDLGDNMKSMVLKGIAAGNFIAAHDLIFVKSSMALSPMGKVARWCYLVSPWVAMSTSFVATQHLINKAYPQERYKPWTFGVSMLAPSLIWGTYKRSLGSTVRVALVGGAVAYVFKYMFEEGIALGSKPGLSAAWRNWDNSSMLPHNNPFYGTATEENPWPNWWKGQDRPAWVTRKFDKQLLDRETDLEPSWMKHIPPEDRNKGPPVGS